MRPKMTTRKHLNDIKRNRKKSKYWRGTQKYPRYRNYAKAVFYMFKIKHRKRVKER